MYYTNIKHYLRLKEEKHEITGVCVIYSGIALAVIINLALMLL